MQVPRVSSVQALTLSDFWPVFFHAEYLCPTWSIIAYLLLQAGEKEKNFC